ncbi:MAG TPA: ferredoxin [Rugosimonospora sp.]|nr:ferredoxin [Rugosimonospora sp.]
MWRLEVTRDCIGTGSCVGIAPRHFALGADNRSHPLAEVVDPDPVVLDAAASCPMEAILVRDASTGDPVEA